MNSWLKIGVPVIIAVLLVAASVGITLAVTGGNTIKQVASPAYSSTAQTSDTQYARGALCPNCPGYGQGATAPDADDTAGNVYIPGGAKCPNCPGYGQGTDTTTGQPGTGTTSYRGGCCGR
jgi:hypothetical protein